jgi:ankyrin repeat protein
MSGDTEIVDTCLSYMALEIRSFDISILSTEAVDEKLPFLKYSTTYWGKHAKASKDEVILAKWWDQVTKISRRESCIGNLFYPWMHELERDQHLRYLNGRLFLYLGVNSVRNISITTLHFFAYFGIAGHSIESYIKLSDHQTINLQTPVQKFTALSLALRAGHEDFAILLLGRNDTNVNLLDSYGRTALLYAIEERCEAVVKLLLDISNTEVNLRDKKGRIPLELAAKVSYSRYDINIIGTLLHISDIDGHLVWSDGTTLLIHTFLREDLLKTHSIDFSTNSPDFFTPLFMLVNIAKENKTKVRYRMEASKEQSRLSTFLKLLYHTKLSEGGREGISQQRGSRIDHIVRNFIRMANVDVNRRNGDGNTPLLMAMRHLEHGFIMLPILYYLLNRKDINVNLGNEISGITPLMVAIQRGQEMMVRDLLEGRIFESIKRTTLGIHR